mmetsp:Transcript_5997/g.12657  ORF Transcript_5997/g.12657 Transcript_5997/m.12657 type:complete len:125 (-) Transcript_5997:10-384(-)
MSKLNIINIKPENKKELVTYIKKGKNLFDLTSKGLILTSKDILIHKSALICECLYNIEKNAFELKYIKTRFDKATANYKSVVDSVIECTKQSISKQHLIQALSQNDTIEFEQFYKNGLKRKRLL